MDAPGAKRCPICGSPHDTYTGLAMHLVKMENEEHSHIETVDEGLEYLVYHDLLLGCSHGEGSTSPKNVELGYA